MPKGQDKTWLEQHGRVWGMPDLKGERYLFEAFCELGQAQVVGMGVGPLAWTEITAFASATGALTNPWEFRAVRQMSEQYLAALKQGESPLVIPPAERGLSVQGSQA